MKTPVSRQNCFVLLRWFRSPCKDPKRMLSFRRDRISDPTEFYLTFSIESSMNILSLFQTQSRESCVPCFGACAEATNESRSQETKMSKWHVNHIMPSCWQLNLEIQHKAFSAIFIYFLSYRVLCQPRCLCVPGKLLSQDAYLRSDIFWNGRCGRQGPVFQGMTFGAPKKRLVLSCGTSEGRTRQFHRNLDPEEENSQVADPVDETRKWPSNCRGDVCRCV